MVLKIKHYFNKKLRNSPILIKYSLYIIKQNTNMTEVLFFYIYSIFYFNLFLFFLNKIKIIINNYK
jgi:hypothetical protein